MELAAPERKTSISMSMADIRETLSRAEESTAAAERARADMQQAVKNMEESKKILEVSVANAQKAVDHKCSFDAAWDEFKAKFDRLNRVALERLSGLVGAGVCTETLRPAELITEARVAQVLRRSKNLVVLTGAGISAESGIPTFRGADGFWTVGSKNYQPQELATWEKFDEMPEELWKWYQYRWGICRNAEPNEGHRAIVELEGLVDGSMLVVTQNIDGLHRRAGTEAGHLCEIHGRIDEMRCDDKVASSCCHGFNFDNSDVFETARGTVVKTPKPAANETDERLPVCQVCGVRQRPKILWFDESYNEAFYKWDTVKRSTADCDVLLVIGTQLTTGGPRRMIQQAQQNGAIIIKMDTIVDLSDSSSAGMLHIQGKSGEMLPRILAELRALREEPLPAPLASPNSTPPGTPPKTPPKASSSGSRRASGSAGTSTPAAVGRKSISGASSSTSSIARSSSTSRAAPEAKASSFSSSTARLRSSSTASRGTGNKGTLAMAATISLGSNTRASPLSSGRAPTFLPPIGNPKGSSDAVGFFVYGTLRPDDDSGAAWTKGFCEGLDGEAAFLHGASLYVDGSYPAVCLEQTRSSVRGVLLKPCGSTAEASSTIAAKLVEADKIEGYPDLYRRSIVTVQTASGKAERAYLYHRTGRTDRSQCASIADGDWMSRRRTRQQ